MIHIIPQHIRRGSWPPWYKLINFKENVNFLIDDESKTIERDLNQENHSLKIKSFLNKLNINSGDSVFLDVKYFEADNGFDNFKNSAIFTSNEYNCKLFIIDGDNQFDYYDCEHFTYFSNRFDIFNSNHNFNYFRYRTPYHTWTNNLDELLFPFLFNLRDKKFNFIVGVDKIERLLSLKHIFTNKMNTDGYIGYSGFSKAYSDESISDNLLDFRNTTLPIILDTPFDRSEQGAVNVEFPPLPICLNSYVSCICETHVIDSNELHLSEKAWNPFISHNIPLILGSKHINEYLKGLGFWLADDLFDITPKNNKTEIINQFKSNLDIINNMSYDKLYNYFYKNIPNITKNFTILMNQKFIFDRNNYK
jgi:hypothetical protein